MIVFAISCHPDDMEFMMGGTLLLLKQAECTIHYINVANGSAGSTTMHVARLCSGGSYQCAQF